MDTIARKIVKGWTVEVALAGDSQNECDWFAITAHDDKRIVTLATIPNVSVATDVAMNDYFDSTVEAIEKFGTIPPFAPHTHFSSRLMNKAVADTM